LEAEGGLNGGNWAAIADQGHHTGNECLIGATTKERCASAGAEGFAADLTLEARPGLAMTANVALSGLASCRTVDIRAEYVWRTHRFLLVFGDTQDSIDTFATFSSAGSQSTI
jgi:hypothetical protein